MKSGNIRGLTGRYKTLLLLFLITAAAFTAYVPDSMPNVINAVRDCNANGNDSQDDTDALKQAVSNDEIRFCYIPNGIYHVNDRLLCGTEKFSRRKIHGQSRDGVIIKLQDNCPGFQDTANPKAVLSFEGGFPDQNFQNYVQDLTIDIGRGNPGAVGIMFQTVNYGAVYNVTIKSTDANWRGYIGLGLIWGNIGPAMIKNVEVDGFEYATMTRNGLNLMIFEDVVFKNQRKQVVATQQGLPLIFRRLTSENSVPVFYGRGFLGFIDCNFLGGSPTSYCIKRDWDIDGLYLRNVTFEGYGKTIDFDERPDILEKKIMEFCSDTVRSIFPSQKSMLQLPVEEFPDLSSIGWNTAADTRNFDPEPNEGTEVSLQQIIDDGYETILITSQQHIHSPVIVRNKVRRIVGVGGAPRLMTWYDVKTGAEPMFRIEDGQSDTVVFENLEFGGLDGGNEYVFEHASTRTLVLKDVGGNEYRNTVSGGKVFMQNVSMSTMQFHGQQAWLRQINPEKDYNPKILNDGGSLWIFGIKTEDEGTIIKTVNHGKTEVIGSMFYIGQHTVPNQPCFWNEESQFSACCIEIRGHYDIYVHEKRDGVLGNFTPYAQFYSGHTANVQAMTLPDSFLNTNPTVRLSRKNGQIRYTPGNMANCMLRIYSPLGAVVSSCRIDDLSRCVFPFVAIASGAYILHIKADADGAVAKGVVVK
ncbi:MAG: hypothetical protein GF350_06040 [Chitinivibrionales bacterium]|nr:hypothetical protein [Chitinivibrionales bacterium]